MPGRISMIMPLASKTAVALALVLAGCRAQRELVIVSDPPGAEIRLDRTLLDVKTPAKIPFDDYGVRRVTLYLDGYLSHSEAIDIRPPWYGYFPLDFVSEILLPIGWHDRHKLTVKLEPGSSSIDAPDLLGVLERAESLRRAGPEGPMLEAAPAARMLPRDTTGSATSEPAPEPKPQPPTGGGGVR